MITIEVAPGFSAARLDRFLASHDAVGTRTLAARLLAAGAVRVDDEQRHKAFRLQPGMIVTIDIDEPSAPTLTADATVPHRIAYEDADILIVDKPAGVVVHPTPGWRHGTLVHALVATGIAGGADQERPGIVHRLDRDTSGLMVVAKTSAAWNALANAMRRRAIEREYTALVHGRPSARSGRIEAPIGRDRRRSRMSTTGAARRAAVTHFQASEFLAETTLLGLRLETGRTHQIRVHLEAIGHPIVGDAVYCPPELPRFGLERQFLHAVRLSLDQPITGARITIDSPLPADLAAALEQTRSAAPIADPAGRGGAPGQ